MTEYLIDAAPPAEKRLDYKRDYNPFFVAKMGNGFLAGAFPDGITTIKGVPVSADIRVILRTPVNGYGDGVVVAKTQSKADGTWRVENLPMHLKYDIVARYFGERDVIASNISPEPM